MKEADFFCTQGGHLDDWGKSWIPIIADGLHHARLLAYFIGSGTLFPNSVGFSPPNTKTVLELREDEFPFLWELQGERVHD